MRPSLIRSDVDLAVAMAARRKALGMSQLACDDRAGMQVSYTSKLEIPGRPHGRRAIKFYSTWDWWSGALDVDLYLVSREHAAAFEALKAPPASILCAPLGMPVR